MRLPRPCLPFPIAALLLSRSCLAPTGLQLGWHQLGCQLGCQLGWAHCAGKDAGGVLCLDVWRHLFGNPAVAAEAWTTFVEGPEEEVRRNAGRRAVPYNRVAWSVPVVTLGAGSIFLALVARSQLIPCTVALCNPVAQFCGGPDGLCGCLALACPSGLRLCSSPGHAWH